MDKYYIFMLISGQYYQSDNIIEHPYHYGITTSSINAMGNMEPGSDLDERQERRRLFCIPM